MIAERTDTLDLELVADGLGFPEGPIWMLDGSIILVEIKAKRLSRISPDGRRSTIAEFRGGPNGAAVGPDGAIYVCNNGGMAFLEKDGLSMAVSAAPDHVGGSIDRVDLATGAVTTLYTEGDGRKLNSPNDIVFDRHGGFWFTDLGRGTELFHDVGALYYATPDGRSIRRVRGAMHSPNGVGLSPGGDRVYVAETFTSRVWCHDVVSPGEIRDTGDMWKPGEVLGPLPGYQLLDSMAVDAAGNVCVATLLRGGVTIFPPDGSATTFLPVPDIATTNLCFGGGDMRDVWITASSTGRLYRGRWRGPGLELAHYA